MSESEAQTGPDALRQRKLLEDQISQCDIVIDKLYGTIELFTLAGSTPDAQAIHTDAAKGLVYYTNKRLALIDALRQVATGNTDPLTQIKLLGGINFNELAPKAAQAENPLPELPSPALDLPAIEPPNTVSDTARASYQFDSFVDSATKEAINSMPRASDLLADTITPLLHEIVQLKREIAQNSQQTELALLKAKQAEANADQAISYGYRLTLIIFLLVVGFSSWQYVAWRNALNKQAELQTIVDKLLGSPLPNDSSPATNRLSPAQPTNRRGSTKHTSSPAQVH